MEVNATQPTGAKEAQLNFEPGFCSEGTIGTMAVPVNIDPV
jgi:hypothetical protein